MRDFSVSRFLSYIVPSHDGPPQDSDYSTRTLQKPFDGIAPYGADAMAGSNMLNDDLAAGAIPSNLGKIGDSGSFPQIQYSL